MKKGKYTIDPEPSEQRGRGIIQVSASTIALVKNKQQKNQKEVKMRHKAKTFSIVLAVMLASVPMAFAQNPVKFQVNMNYQVRSGLFDISADSVAVRGGFNGWGTLWMTKDASDTIYTVVDTLADSLVGDTIQYKYYSTNPNVSWESTVPSPAVGGNRWFKLVSGGQVLPVVYFNQDSTVGLKVNVTFSVNMSFMEQTNYFQPDSGDKVFLRGDIMPGGWGPGTQMTENPLNPGHYSAVVALTSTPGDTTGYKYFIQTSRIVPPLPPNGGWEEGPHGANYPFIFPSADEVVPERAFDDISGVLKTPVTLIFSVNMKHAVNAITGAPFPSLDSVFVGGSEAPLSWLYGQAWADSMHSMKMYDDGTHGDLVAGDSIYSQTFTFPVGAVNKVWFMYSAFYHPGYPTGGIEQNEQNTQNNFDNHQMIIPDSAGTTPLRLTTNIFGNYLDTTTVVTAVRSLPDPVPSTFELAQNYPNPFNPTTMIRYSVPQKSQVTLKIYNVLGQEVATLFSGSQAAGTYEVNFDASRFASGVYFYRLQAGSFSSVKKMMLMK